MVGIAVTPNLEIIFDTLTSTRKFKNLKANKKIAFVIGWKNEITLQYQGIAVQPVGKDLIKSKQIYFSVFPEGKEREELPNIAYFKVKPEWIRYSDFNNKTKIIEMKF